MVLKRRIKKGQPIENNAVHGGDSSDIIDKAEPKSPNFTRLDKMGSKQNDTHDTNNNAGVHETIEEDSENIDNLRNNDNNEETGLKPAFPPRYCVFSKSCDDHRIHLRS